MASLLNPPSWVGVPIFDILIIGTAILLYRNEALSLAGLAGLSVLTLLVSAFLFFTLI
ncbi:MAG: hypothetical protein K2Q10_12615 [Rhodospirillales bacterium]|nr:hypothetical protein [Rhodospirillales bacterium]